MILVFVTLARVWLVEVAWGGFQRNVLLPVMERVSYAFTLLTRGRNAKQPLTADKPFRCRYCLCPTRGFRGEPFCARRGCIWRYVRNL